MNFPKYYQARHPTQPGEYALPKGAVGEIDSAVRYEAKPGDLFLCDYPKCGVTWLQNIVWRILNEGQGMTKVLREHIAFLEFDGAEHVEATRTGNRHHIIKTHFPYNWVPKHPKSKYIFIAREPKDVCISLYHHIAGFGVYYEWINGTFDEHFQAFLNGKLDAGDYFVMLREWYSVKDDPSVLFLLYEEMKTDTSSQLLKIAKFLGQEYVEKLTANNSKMLEKVIEETSFKNMQKSGQWTTSKREGTPFIRKGIIGDWESLMTPEQATAIDNKLRKTCGIEIEKLWAKWKKT